MKVKLSLIFLVLHTVVADMYSECDMAGFYRELGCRPAPKVDNSTKCPDAFTCPDLHPNRTQCYYRGKSYNNKDMIPQALVRNPCSQVCMCVVGTAETNFQCAAVDCVETFGNDMEQCIYIYDLDSCCYTGTVCGKDDVNNLKTCEVEGKVYREGQQFYPNNTSKTCICTTQWNGKADGNPDCRDIDCGIEIHYQNKLMEKCAPIFLESDPRSCPIGFQCRSKSSKVVGGLNLRNIRSQCVFGDLTLGVGDEVTVDDPCVKCSCDVPPFVTCTQGPRNDHPTC